MTPGANLDGFEMRLEDGVYHVYLTRVRGRDLPRAEQVSVMRDRSRAKVQPVADALNNGLLRVISFAITRSMRA